MADLTNSSIHKNYSVLVNTDPTTETETAQTEETEAGVRRNDKMPKGLPNLSNEGSIKSFGNRVVVDDMSQSLTEDFE